MSIKDYLNPREDYHYMSDEDYDEAVGLLSGKLYVGAGFDMYEELKYFIEQDGRIDTIQLEIAPETVGNASYGDLEISDWLEKVFSSFNKPRVKFVPNVAECVHHLEIEGGYKTVEEAVTMLCEAFSHLIKNAPFPIVFEEYDGENGGDGFDRTMFPCINGTPKMEYPKDAEDTEDIEINEPEEDDEDIPSKILDGKVSDSLKMTYQVALAAYPKETQELLKTLRSSRSKNKNADPTECYFEITYRLSTRVAGMSLGELLGGVRKTEIEPTIDAQVAEFKANAVGYLILSIGKYETSIELDKLPQIAVDHYRRRITKDHEEETERRNYYNSLTPEEKEADFNKTISKLQGYGGFMMIGGTPDFSKKNEVKDKIIHNGDNTISMQKADGTVEVIGSVESLGRGQYFGTFGDLDDFPFESLDSAIYWIEDCYRSKNGDGQFYKFQQAIKRRRDKGIEF